jgi:hypothetical protein
MYDPNKDGSEGFCRKALDSAGYYFHKEGTFEECYI